MYTYYYVFKIWDKNDKKTVLYTDKLTDVILWKIHAYLYKKKTKVTWKQVIDEKWVNNIS